MDRFTADSPALLSVNLVKSVSVITILLQMMAMASGSIALPGHHHHHHHHHPPPHYPHGFEYPVRWTKPPHGQNHRRPVDVMTDVINDLGVKILDRYIEHNGNVGFSPSGLGFVVVALYEGSAGSSSRQISETLGLPNDRRITRIGFRDIHRRLRSYLNADAFLGGLTLNRDDINLRPEYEDILRFYGFDISDSGNTTSTVSVSLTTGTLAASTLANATDAMPTQITQATSSPATVNDAVEILTNIAGDQSSALTMASTSGATTTTTPTAMNAMSQAAAVINAASTGITTTTSASTVVTNGPTVTSSTTPMPSSTVAASATTMASMMIMSIVQAIINSMNASTTMAPVQNLVGPPTVSADMQTQSSDSSTVSLGTSPSNSLLATSPMSTVVTMPMAAMANDSMMQRLISTSTQSAADLQVSNSDGSSVTVIGTVGSTTPMIPVMSSSMAATTNPTDGMTRPTTNPMTNATSPTINPMTGATIILTTNATSPATNPITETTINLITNATSPTMNPMIGATINLVTNATNPITGTTINPTTNATSPPANPMTGATINLTTNATSPTTNPATNATSPAMNLMRATNPTTPPMTTLLTMPVTTIMTTLTMAPETTTDSVPTSGTTMDSSITTQVDNTVTMTMGDMMTNTVRKRRSVLQGPSGYFSSSADDSIWLDVFGRLTNNDDYQSQDEDIVENPSPPTQLDFLVNGCDYSRVTAATYTAVLPFAYFPSLQTSLLEFPLDDPRYKILVMLPSESNGTRRLTRILATKSITIRHLRRSLQPTWVTAIIPSFMLRGFVTLTPYLQRLGIADVFEPRTADLSPMSPDLGVYARDIQQSIGVNIRNNMKGGIGGADGGNGDQQQPQPANLARGTRGIVGLPPFFAAGGAISPRSLGNIHYSPYPGGAGPIPFVVDRPFLYFIVDDQTSVSLLAGRIDDPLNSRIML